jgi:hypothetical protein
MNAARLTCLYRRSGDSARKPRDDDSELGGTEVAPQKAELHPEGAMMSLVRLLGFTTLTCGCVTGKYREIATHREVTYVEEKGAGCANHAHRRNHTLGAARTAAHAPIQVARAS